MRTAWHPAAMTLADTEDVGFFKRVNASGRVDVYRVKWNRTNTARYVHRVDVDTMPGKRPVFAYERSAPLSLLEPDDRVTGAQLLHYLAKHGPWGACLFCTKPLYEAPHTTVGIGPSCAERHLDASPRLLSTIHSAVAPRRHLRLVCVNGRRVD